MMTLGKEQMKKAKCHFCPAKSSIGLGLSLYRRFYGPIIEEAVAAHLKLGACFKARQFEEPVLSVLNADLGHLWLKP